MGLSSNGTENLHQGSDLGRKASSFVQAGGTWIAQRSEFASSDGLWQVEGIAAEHIDVLKLSGESRVTSSGKTSYPSARN